MKTSSLFTTALFALALATTAAIAAPASKSTTYQRGSLAPKSAGAEITQAPTKRATFMPVKNPGRKFTSMVKCTPERMQSDAACRAHCAR